MNLIKVHTYRITSFMELTNSNHPYEIRRKYILKYFYSNFVYIYKKRMRNSYRWNTSQLWSFKFYYNDSISRRHG